MKAKNLLFPFFFIFPLFTAAAQEEDISADGSHSEIVYVIRSIDFAIEGRTRESALAYYGEFKAGERIAGRENFEKYLSEKQQLITNKRNHDHVSIDYTLGEAEEGGILPVDLLVSVSDTWNFVILPEPKYDSNEGFSLTLKARDYNFLGTMNPLRLDIGYLFSTENKNVFKLSLDSDTPFYAAGLRWNLNFDNIFNYIVGDPLEYKNITGVSVELPAGFTTVTVGIDQYLVINEENGAENKVKYNLSDDRLEGAYAATQLYSSWKIPTGFFIDKYGEVKYVPGVSGKIAYRSGGVDEPRRPIVSLSQSLGFGRINWIGNYRSGLEASIGNTNNFYFDPNDYLIYINAGVTLHHRFMELLGISSRLQYRHWFHGLKYDAADLIRGFPTNNLRAENMLSINLDLPFRLVRFAPSEWLDNRKLRLFNFEMHLSPFMDISLMNGYQIPFTGQTGEKISFGDILFGSGFEIIAFPDFFKSFYIRASAGYNMNKIINTHNIPKWDELFIGIGHHY
ncbi:MAG: hypothetical protein LBH43_21510 [Treponema sp.]|nr:hypothetical protein [Treponema sp.]